jgi:hypothetical protein
MIPLLRRMSRRPIQPRRPSMRPATPSVRSRLVPRSADDASSPAGASLTPTPHTRTGATATYCQSLWYTQRSIHQPQATIIVIISSSQTRDHGAQLVSLPPRPCTLRAHPLLPHHCSCAACCAWARRPMLSRTTGAARLQTPGSTSHSAQQRRSVLTCRDGHQPPARCSHPNAPRSQTRGVTPRRRL